MAKIVALPGYSTSFGNKKAAVIDLYGSATYAAATGDTLTAHQLGWGGIDFAKVANLGLATVNSQLVVVPLSFSGTYFVAVQLASTASGAVKSLTVKWYTTASGVEVVGPADLSAEKVRLLVIGV